MTVRLDQLAQRRAELQVRAQAQRAQLGYYLQRLEPSVRLGTTLVGFADTLRKSPFVWTGLGVLLLKTPWRKFWRVPKLAWRTWKIIQFVRGWTRKSR